MIKLSKLLKNKNKIFSNLFNEKYEHKFGEFNKTAETERDNIVVWRWKNGAKFEIRCRLNLGNSFLKYSR